MATADVLGIFGREDVFAANVWGSDPTTPFFHAGFYAFANYDGQGGRFGDMSVSATTSNHEATSVYASVDEGSDDRMVLVVLNKSAGAANAEITLRHPIALSQARAYQITSAASAVTSVTSPSFTGATSSERAFRRRASPPSFSALRRSHQGPSGRRIRPVDAARGASLGHVLEQAAVAEGHEVGAGQRITGEEARQDRVHHVVPRAAGAAGRTHHGHRPEPTQEQEVAGIHGRPEGDDGAPRPLQGAGSDVVAIHDGRLPREQHQPGASTHRPPQRVGQGGLAGLVLEGHELDRMQRRAQALHPSSQGRDEVVQDALARGWRTREDQRDLSRGKGIDAEPPFASAGFRGRDRSAGRAKGITFTVATSCDARTGVFARRVATVRPSWPFRAKRRSGSTRNRPGPVASRLARPVCGPTRRRPGPIAASARRRAASFSATSPGPGSAT